MATQATTQEIVELSAPDGVAFIGQDSLLTRLHYFDGQYLRASALNLEQHYHRHALALGNRAAGWGVVEGLDVVLEGEALRVTPGLAVTPAGQLVLAGFDMQAPLSELLSRTTPAPAAGAPGFGDCLQAQGPGGVPATAGLQVYEITVGPVEGLCGNEPVYGKLCETACATDSRRPYWREGVILRLRPVALALPDSAAFQHDDRHLRNRIASAYFAAEGQPVPDLLSAAGLAGTVWCRSARVSMREEVVIGLLWREGSASQLDAWSGRREHMQGQAQGYWQARLAMRPWNVFMAQVLQFQCQLASALGADRLLLPASRSGGGPAQPEALSRAIQSTLDDFERRRAAMPRNPRKADLQEANTELWRMCDELRSAIDALAPDAVAQAAGERQGSLLAAGFMDLPPAGYLPVSTGMDLQPQLEGVFGPGVDLHLHAVRDDEIAHLLEQAAHLARISLTRGLEDPRAREAVEVFVPGGVVTDARTQAPGTWWRPTLTLSDLLDLLDLLKILEAVADLGKPDTSLGEALELVRKRADDRKGRGTDLDRDLEASRTSSTRQTRAAADPKTAAAAGGSVADQPPAVDVPPGASSRPKRSAVGLDGLARTQAHDDGSRSLTLLLRPEHPPQAGQEAEFLRAFYLAADLARDPFGLAEGEQAALKVQISSVMHPSAQDNEGIGALTVLSQQRVLSDGSSECRVQCDLQVTQHERMAVHTTPWRFQLLLQRDLQGREGWFLVDDENRSPAWPALRLEWRDDPRRAALYQLQSDPEGASTRRRLLALTALPAMPEPESALATQAMDTLAELAESVDDAALLLRGRRRLFPVLEAPQAQAVRATRDWALFRRARTHLCGPACVTPAAAVEAFQVWHLRLEDEKNLDQDLEVLRRALDNGSDPGPAFAFRRVGILRYRDESADAEESAERIVAMWQAAQPAARVLLGRVWEVAPQTGQGWQNHMRLRNMLKQIAGLTQPPGTGALSAIRPPAGELDDRALDGGMLVVTFGQAERRNALLVYGNYDPPGHYLQADAPSSPMEFLDNAPQGNALVNYLRGLTPNQPVLGVTLATTREAPDEPGARQRLDAVVGAVRQELGTDLPAHRQQLVRLSEHDRKELSKLPDVDPDGFDEIVFFELNHGG